MKFGPVPVSQAEGAVLAHSVGLPDGRLRKGVMLGAAEIARLSAGGIDEVTVARLEPGDLDEDTAATRLADALVPDPGAAGLRLSAAFTGRVNVIATGPGVIRVDVAGLSRVNDIDPMITVATLPDMAQVTEGTMVATIKIIAYGVAERDVASACAAGRDTIRRVAPALSGATLIMTEIPGGAGEKGAEAIRGRLSALGMDMLGPVTVPHRMPELGAAITAAQGDLILILTGSATSDPLDVAPEALRRAGGRVERFGMPVDPGNLLFLGARGDGVPVIGLPGCARSPALNGADWVLSRMACGIGVTARDISAMGVGGLLKEIPARGMPRSRPPGKEGAVKGAKNGKSGA